MGIGEGRECAKQRRRIRCGARGKGGLGGTDFVFILVSLGKQKLSNLLWVREGKKGRGKEEIINARFGTLPEVFLRSRWSRNPIRCYSLVHHLGLLCRGLYAGLGNRYLVS